ncbi:hypothetical protein V3851_03695 [Paenibacillus sp. M1]|uniref:Uncharacterized protein n=1 Tax=Paenibacillus haidiansis TaxID=1574488 RepID=A0ABU7VNP5_9BACL
MAKTDWNLHDTVRPEDMNELGEELNSHAAAISKLETRLDTGEYADITLQPGLQVISAERDARFRLGEVRGRTLVNLLGSDGSGEVLNRLAASVATVTLDTSTNSSAKTSLLVTSTGTSAFGVYKDFSVFDKSKYYIALASIKIGTSSRADLRITKSDFTVVKSSGYHTNQNFQTFFVSFSPTELESIDTLRLYARFEGGSIGLTGNVNSIRLYEISKDEYIALSGMTTAQIELKYPYTEGIKGVDSPYVIRYGENLLPPFYEWTQHPRLSVISRYKAQINATADFHNTYYRMPLPVGEKFIFSGEFSGDVGGYIHIRAYDSAGAIIPDLNIITPQFKTGLHSLKFTVPNGAEFVEIVFTNIGIGTFTLENPMLTLGSESKTFKPLKDTMLAFQTELHANPTDGSSPDELFEKDGQYFRLAKWKKVVLDGSQDWQHPTGAIFSGYKRVTIPFSEGNGAATNSQVATKYNGSLLTNFTAGDTSAFTGGDQIVLNSSFNHKIQMTVRNTDSGWGELAESDTFSGDGATKSYILTPTNTNTLIPSTISIKIGGVATTAFSVSGNVITFTTAPTSGTSNIVVSYTSAYVPSVDEIKAYFMGWRMYIGGSATGEPYNGTGTKSWGKIYSGVGSVSGIPGLVASSGTTTLPTTMNDQGYTPYQLLYRLTSGIVEPIVSEGALTLHEGKNMIEIGTGIVLRERVTPQYFSTTDSWYVNSSYVGWEASRLKNKTLKILSLYDDSLKDNNWKIELSGTTVYGDSFGKERACINNSNYNKSGVYSVTYIKLDKFPIQPISGNVAMNENMQLSDLTSGIAEALHRVSVVEQIPKSKIVELFSGNVGTAGTVINFPVDITQFDYLKVTVNNNGYTDHIWQYKDRSYFYCRQPNITDTGSSLALSISEMRLDLLNNYSAVFSFTNLWQWYPTVNYVVPVATPNSVSSDTLKLAKISGVKV